LDDRPHVSPNVTRMGDARGHGRERGRRYDHVRAQQPTPAISQRDARVTEAAPRRRCYLNYEATVDDATVFPRRGRCVVEAQAGKEV
jgi:hypothetical protein